MIKNPRPSVVALGKFDGLHLGHQKIIEKTIEVANKYSLYSIAYVINISNLITSDDEKAELFKKYGINEIVFEEFSDEFKMMSPEQFFEDIIIKKINAHHIVVGTDYCFGKNRAGNVELLKKLCDKHGINLSVIEKLEVDGEIVSSTRIRELISDGAVKSASHLLGKNYSITASVKEGKHLGRKMGFPTINFFDVKKLTPSKGVYLTKVCYTGKYYNSITNVGVNPTVESGDNIKIETYIFDFCYDIYGKKVTVEFLDKLRNEKKFDNLESLINQIENDKKKALKYFGKYL